MTRSPLAVTFLRLAFLLMLLAAFCLACGDDDDDDNDDLPVDDDDTAADDDDDDDDNDTPAPAFCAVDEQAVDDLLSRMTLRQKFAQMYYIGVDVFPWFDNPQVAALIAGQQVGALHGKLGLTIGLWPEWTVQNVNKLQRMALSAEPGIPLMIGIDQEGGVPQTLSAVTGGTDTPGNLGLGATHDPSATYDAYDIMGAELHAVGVSANFAPVLGVMTDMNETSMYTRCFGSETDEVAAHAAASVQALQDNLVIATAKHFPGQTAAPGDEHYTEPVSELTEQEMRDIYLPPFEAAIAAGVDMIMPTHARYAAWGADLPATFNHAILTDLLRDDLGFEGVIISDDLNMIGVTARDWGELPEVLTILAGADMLIDIFSSFDGEDSIKLPYPDELSDKLDYLVEKVADGTLTEARIDESVRRILRMKIKYCLFEQPFRKVQGASDEVRTEASDLRSADLHRRAVTVVRNDAGLWPLDPESNERIHIVTTGPVVAEMYPGSGWPTVSLTTLLRHMQAIKPSVTGSVYAGTPQNITADVIVNDTAASGADLLVIGSYNAYFDEAQTAMIQRLLDLGIPTILVAQAMPYDLMAFPDVETYLAVYSNRDLALAVTAAAMFGLVEPEGSLPVPLPGLYEAGWSATAE
jgi:beta-N-acetylhexosaminidase